ncbi:Calcineurin subunit B type 1 [Phlyctochytrium bullatum]|nr:Calcineurin subunit B type 1 [Phlyctochytrium bullatum]
MVIACVTLQEIKRLKQEFEKQSTDNSTITKDQFKQTLQSHVHCWSAGAQYLFLERLFDAFDLDGNKQIDFHEFIQGLSTFMKGTPEEKLELSFRLYDIDKSGSIEPKELIKIMGQMSLHEYKLMALKEPIIIDFLEQFLIVPSDKRYGFVLWV